MTKFLLPHKFKMFGAVMLPLGLIIWLAAQLNYFHPYLKSVNFLYPGIQIILIVSFFLFLLGLSFLVFAKEKNEDEYISKVRLESFHFAAYLQIVFFIYSFVRMLFLYDPPGEYEFYLLLKALFIFWLSYIIRFNFILIRNRLRIRNEK